jgi:predicted HD phosphohydrolase
MSTVDTPDRLFELLEQGRTARDGEAVDLLAHALQCAALLADAAPDDAELQVAGLVHDLGTILAPGAPGTHAATGGAAVESLLGSRVAELVSHHDDAKRYLVTVDPSYRSVLSDQSIATLRVQGGLLDPAERTELEALPTFSDLLSLRRADDAAKVAGRAVPALDSWRTVVDAVAREVRG